ncbi:MAG: hypothetical protein ACP5JR_06610 [Thermoplasmata archaeon]
MVIGNPEFPAENLELWADVGRVLVWGILFNVLLITICLQVTLIRGYVDSISKLEKDPTKENFYKILKEIYEEQFHCTLWCFVLWCVSVLPLCHIIYPACFDLWRRWVDVVVFLVPYGALILGYYLTLKWYNKKYHTLVRITGFKKCEKKITIEVYGTGFMLILIIIGFPLGIFYFWVGISDFSLWHYTIYGIVLFSLGILGIFGLYRIIKRSSKRGG